MNIKIAMSEEERKAIEYLEKHVMPYTNKKGKVDFLINDVLLDLIKRLQDEITENRLVMFDDKGHIVATLALTNDVISKYRIEKKIEELKKLYTDKDGRIINYVTADTVMPKVHVLEDILKEANDNILKNKGLNAWSYEELLGE